MLILAVFLVVGSLWWTNRQNNDSGQFTEQTPQPGAAAEQDGKDARKMVKVTAPTTAEVDEAKKAGTIPVTIDTARGPIELELRGDLMPLTVANFVKLAKAGFYDGLTFHRVEDWVIQGGDPQGTGTGGPGYAIKLETNPQMKNVRGAIAMARSSDPNSAGSQFYILRSDADWLNGQYAVFGNVKSGLEIVDKVRSYDKINKVTVGK
jgi:cyclophilin family peptidyl-prolyl cis-trans isomerase